jgi:uncharacterized protein (DUF1501 family)
MTMPHSSLNAYLSRRAVLIGAGAAFGAAYLPLPASAAGSRDPRLVVIILRGALDGLSAVPPIGDSDYALLHGALAFAPSGERAGLPLDGFFAVNPAMPVFARMFKEKRAAAVHAIATHYRERSHFDGQDVLESGYPAPGKTDSGWLNRAVAALPGGAVKRGLGVGSTAPLVIRGPAPVLGWAPQDLPNATDDLAARVLDLYAHLDPELGLALRSGLETEKMAARDGLAEDMKIMRGGMDRPIGMRQAASGAAQLLAAPDGPRVAALAFDGFDTHQNEGAVQGLLATRLAGLDGAFEEFEKGLGQGWKDTIIVAVTEFGRTARVNGTNGTDHGTGTVAFLAGGAVAGGRVIADWPGLSQERLYQGRDLFPTTDLRAILKGIFADQFGISRAVLAEKIFPDSAAVAPRPGLVV